jgi:SP family general alpha glucoside:H+ symporter-like MFS transporter
MAVDTDDKNFRFALDNDEKPFPVRQNVPRQTNEPGRNEQQPDEANKTTMSDVIRSARLATEKEHKMSLLQGIKLYPKAIGWSILISTCIVMEGYDVSLINNFYGFAQFNRKYGEPYVNKQGVIDYQVPAAWQAGLSNGATVVR